MSVLVEALCLIVPRSVLDLRYPGGTEGYFAELARPSAEHRNVCADEHLLSVSFYTPDAAERAIACLLDVGFVESRDDDSSEFSLVDQNSGPMMQVPWLKWSQDEAGYTCAWLEGTERGELAVPLEWTLGQSLRLTRFDARTPPHERLKLSEDKGVETWLDLMTGRILKRLRIGVNRDRKVPPD